MKLIESKTLGTAAASIEFTSIPQTFTDLVVLTSGRGTRASLNNGVLVVFNNVLTDYTTRTLFGNGSSAASNTDLNIRAGAMTGTPSTANTFGSSQMYIPNYTSSNFKSLSVDSVNENNGTEAYQWLVSTLWSNTAAITSIKFTVADALDFVTGSTISLYGILKGSDGIVTTS